MKIHTKTGEGEIRERVAELLKQVGLPGVEDQLPADLSGGMKKRVAIGVPSLGSCPRPRVLTAPYSPGQDRSR